MFDYLYWYIIRYRNDKVMIQIPHMTSKENDLICYSSFELETIGL